MPGPELLSTENMIPHRPVGIPHRPVGPYRSTKVRFSSAGEVSLFRRGKWTRWESVRGTVGERTRRIALYVAIEEVANWDGGYRGLLCDSRPQSRTPPS
jgi:hypothetical protein